ncbi:hypothetical protein B0T12DRAFT_423863 [Alternaria alternata]|nr:hypothetical protein B0T12DRAFT_423863 [Alternaria alternata]KAH8627707.1 hypothetical protein IG631_17475 [Alternaria alternata]
MPSQNQPQQSSTGGRPTGATGGGYNRYPCDNWQQEGHPQNYTFVDQKGRLCAHCMVSPSVSQFGTALTISSVCTPPAMKGKHLEH